MTRVMMRFRPAGAVIKIPSGSSFDPRITPAVLTANSVMSYWAFAYAMSAVSCAAAATDAAFDAAVCAVFAVDTAVDAFEFAVEAVACAALAVAWAALASFAASIAILSVVTTHADPFHTL